MERASVRERRPKIAKMRRTLSLFERDKFVEISPSVVLPTVLYCMILYWEISLYLAPSTSRPFLILMERSSWPPAQAKASLV